MTTAADSIDDIINRSKKKQEKKTAKDKDSKEKTKRRRIAQRRDSLPAPVVRTPVKVGRQRSVSASSDDERDLFVRRVTKFKKLTVLQRNEQHALRQIIKKDPIKNKVYQRILNDPAEALKRREDRKKNREGLSEAEKKIEDTKQKKRTDKRREKRIQKKSKMIKTEKERDLKEQLRKINQELQEEKRSQKKTEAEE